VKVEDPSFAKRLSIECQTSHARLRVNPVPGSAHSTNCRKVHLSWHRATRSVRLDFGNGEIANLVAQRFNDGTYKCLGQLLKASTPRSSSTQGRGRGGGQKPLTWTLILSDVPSEATLDNVLGAITAPNHRPRNVEMGATRLPLRRLAWKSADSSRSMDRWKISISYHFQRFRVSESKPVLCLKMKQTLNSRVL
jgi:hypothetical protein